MLAVLSHGAIQLVDVPSLLFEPMILDKDKVMQTVIKDGYHKLEDVYKNVPKDQWPKQ